MNDDQRNRLRMFKTVRDYLAENPGVWNGIPAHVTVHTTLAGRITAIDSMVTAQEAVITGHTAAKRTLRRQLEAAILLLANAGAAYARSVGDEVMLAVVDLSPTDLAVLSEQVIDDKAAHVVDAVGGSLGALADYGITVADLNALEAAVSAYEAAKTTPDVLRAQRAGMTAALQPLFQQTSALLSGQLDPLMARYKTSDPTFHAGYEAARVIIDLRGPGDPDEPEPEPDPEPDPGP